MNKKEELSSNPSGEPPESTEVTPPSDASTLLTMVCKSLTHAVHDASDVNKILSINCVSQDTYAPATHQAKVHHIYRFAHKQSCLSQCQLVDTFSTFDCQLHQLKDADVDWSMLRPDFGWTSTENIKNTFTVTTRYGLTPPPPPPPMIISRNISKTGILSSTSPGATKLLLLTLPSQTVLPLTMVAKCTIFCWERHLGL